MSREISPPALPVESGVEFRHIPGLPGYVADSEGRIWSCKRGPFRAGAIAVGAWRQLTEHQLPKGYRFVGLSHKGKRAHELVHRLVLLAFVGPCPDGMECRHFPDHNPANNRPSNLQWGTPTENVRDTINQGRFKHCHRFCESHGRAKLTDDQAREICRLYAMGGVKQIDLARQFGVSQTEISKIVRKDVFKQLWPD